MNPDQNNQNQLDPSVLNVTKTIGYNESGGNYNAPRGKDGEQGAYQMTPGFIKRYAPKYLAGQQYDPGNLNPAQQNQLAYSVAHEWGTTGDPDYPELGKLSPAQILSKWNSGNPNAYLEPGGHSGVSAGGAKYSTSSYVNKGEATYAKLAGSPSGQPGVAQAGESAPTPQTPQKPGTSQWEITPYGFGEVKNGKAPSVSQKIGGPLGLGGDLLLGATGAGIALLPQLSWMLRGGAEAGAGAAATGASEAAPGILSKIGGLIKSGVTKSIGGVVTGGAIGEGEKIFNDITGNNQPAPTGGDNASGGGSSTSDMSGLESQLSPTVSTSNSLKTGLLQMLSNTQTGTRLMQDPIAHEAIDSMGMYGLAPEIKDGRVDFSAADNTAQTHIGDISKGMQSVLRQEGSHAPVTDLVKNAAEHLYSHAPSHEWADGEKEIMRVAKEYGANFGSNGNLSLASIERLKRETGSGAKFGLTDAPAKRNAFRALNIGAKKTILAHTKHADLYTKALKEEQKLFRAKALMKHLNGKKTPKEHGLMEMFLKQGARAMEIYVGDKIGGPLGAIVGGLIGEHFNKSIGKHFDKDIFESPDIKRSLEALKETKPEVYQKIKTALADYTKDTLGKDKEQSKKEKKLEDSRIQGLIELVQKGDKSPKKIGKVLMGKVSAKRGKPNKSK